MTRTFPRFNRPLTFLLGSGSELKRAALQDALEECDIFAAVVDDRGAESGINEQPYGMLETLRGALNRATHVEFRNPQGDLYFSVENGIEAVGGGFQDFAIALVYAPRLGLIQYVKSAAYMFPVRAVEETWAKEGGFEKNTVGRKLQEMGLVQRHDDPHLDLYGISRKDIIKDAFVELLHKLPDEAFTPREDND